MHLKPLCEVVRVGVSALARDSNGMEQVGFGWLLSEPP